MHFQFPQKVLFKHCDPAGIAFYPRIFEMINDAVEAMFNDLLGWPFETMHAEYGVPTIAINIEFKAPSVHGDHLILQISILEIGRTSLSLNICALAKDTIRFEANHTLVCINSNGKPVQWPEKIRQKVNTLMENHS